MSGEHSVTFESTRIPIDCSIDLRFDHFSGFEEHYAANISMGGMFIRTGDLHAPGTRFELRFELEDGQPLIQGMAEVLWRRAEDRGPNRPAGIGVRFLSLDLESKYVIYRMVDRHIQLGGTPFDLEASQEGGQPSPVKAARSRAVALGSTLAVLLLVAVGGFAYLRFARAPDGESITASTTPPATADLAAEEGPDVAEASPPREPRPATGGTDSVADAEPEPAGGDADDVADEATRAVETAVAAWARAWAEKDVAAYLASYAADFRPLSGMSHDAWADERRARLSRPGPIEVELSNLGIELLAGDRARARFDQAYASPTYRDRVRKMLELERRAGAWKIVWEEVEDSAA